ncbi:MAG: glycosyltransferase [Planctomycetes bacterium]|nr:glycosyltransferase [Planctomycetota bacterium]
MRICLYTPSLGPNATPTHIIVDALARQMMARGHLVSVLAQCTRPAFNPPYAVHYAPPPMSPDWFPERSARALAAFHEANAFELICVFDAHPTGYGAMRVAHDANVPLVIVSMGGDLYHGSPMRRKGHVWKRIAATYRDADAAVATSPYMMRLLAELDGGPANVVAIHSGVDTATFSQPAPQPGDFDDPRGFCLTIGALEDGSGVGDAIEAYARAHGRLGDTTLIVMGDGSQRAALSKRISQLNLDDRVTFVGERRGTERRWFMQKAKFAMIVPHEEGNAMTALQVMACGRPIVCTGESAFDEVCRPGVNGLLVPAASPVALADAIARLQRFEIESMALNSMGIAQDYDWQMVVDGYLKLFAETIERFTASTAGAAT